MFNRAREETIILSKASTNYINWLTELDFNIVNAYTINNLVSLMLVADGIVLIGVIYQSSNVWGQFKLITCEAMDFRRDSREKII